MPDRVREPPVTYGTRRISATDAARNFSEVLNRVKYRGETFIVERSGEPICELRPAAPTKFLGADLVDLVRALPPVDGDFASTIEELGRDQPPLPESPWRKTRRSKSRREG